MRAIVKGAEPASLTQHRQTPHSGYDNYTDKNPLRTALVTEQQGLCCYCMGRIQNEPGKMKVEHWHCQANYPGEQLVYRESVRHLPWEEGQPYKRQHCEYQEGESGLIMESGRSETSCSDTAQLWNGRHDQVGPRVFDRQLNEVLNLNLPRLKNSRKGILDAILEWWQKETAACPQTAIGAGNCRSVRPNGDLCSIYPSRYLVAGEKAHGDAAMNTWGDNHVWKIPRSPVSLAACCSASPRGWKYILGEGECP